MKNPRQLALSSFEENKRTAEKSKAVAERRNEQLENQVADFPQPAWWQFSAVYRLSQLRRELSQVSAQVADDARRIREYQEAIDGINREDYEPAILLIEGIIPRLHEQARSEPMGVMFGAAGLASDLEGLKVELIALSRARS